MVMYNENVTRKGTKKYFLGGTFKMKKLISLLLILILLLSSMTFLASCNEDTPPEESSSESDPLNIKYIYIISDQIEFPDWISDENRDFKHHGGF